VPIFAIDPHPDLLAWRQATEYVQADRVDVEGQCYVFRAWRSSSASSDG
jgi:hypothetical protein